jgi:transcriptional antiterminator Rof (Rho-off)
MAREKQKHRSIHTPRRDSVNLACQHAEQIYQEIMATVADPSCTFAVPSTPESISTLTPISTPKPTNFLKKSRCINTSRRDSMNLACQHAEQIFQEIMIAADPNRTTSTSARKPTETLEQRIHAISQDIISANG